MLKENRIGKDGTRDEVIKKYQTWLLQQLSLLADLPALRGKDHVCWCAPERCHSDILIELANAGPTS